MLFLCETATPEPALLEAAADRNPHGAGMAWLEEVDQGEKGKKNVVRWQKGLDLKGVEALIPRVALPYLIHFRFASVGPNVPQLTHPFPITPNATLELSGTADSVLAHNGHVMGWKGYLRDAILSGSARAPRGVWSDTRALAYMTYRFGPGVLPIVVDDDRVVVFTKDGEFITYGTSWIEKPGFWQSQGLVIVPPKPATPIISFRDHRHGAQGGARGGAQEVIPGGSGSSPRTREWSTLPPAPIQTTPSTTGGPSGPGLATGANAEEEAWRISFKREHLQSILAAIKATETIEDAA